jgi:V-type H+-transporting ATPase subunit G
MPESNALIAQLLEAEQQAEEIVAKARESRAANMKKARDDAQAEADSFRVKEEEKFLEASKKAQASENDGTFSAQAKTELAEVQRDLKRNKERAVNYMFDKVMKIDMELTQNQISLLQKK